MAQLVQIQQCRPEYSENLLPITALISDSSDISFTGDGAVSISEDYQFSDNKSLKLEMPLSPINVRQNIFDLGSDLQKQVKYSGNYIFSFRYLNETNPYLLVLLNIKVNVFVNSILAHTFEIEKGQNDYDDFKFYTLGQSFNLSANDVVNFTFEVYSEEVAPPPTLKLYFSGFKLELDDRFLGIPSIYGKPLVTENETGFQSRTDETNNQSLLSLTDNLVSFSGVLEESGGLDLLNSSAKVTPIALNDIISVDFAFTGVVPIGTNLFLSIYLKVGTDIFRATTLPIIKGVGLDDHFSVSWILPVGADFLSNGATIHVNPLVAMTIKNRYVSVTRLAKGK
jgi:hypothetical protein